MSKTNRILIAGNSALMVLALLWVYYASRCAWVAGEIWADHGDVWADGANFIGLLSVRVWVALALFSIIVALKKGVSRKHCVLLSLLGLILWIERSFNR